MNRQKKHITIKVGIFMLAGVICLFAYIFLLGGNRTYFNLTAQYKVKFSSVEGLFTGSVVTINGVSAGNVKNIHFIQKTGEVEAVISVMRRYAPVITDEAHAVLATKGLLGDKYIAIKTTGQKGRPLPMGSYIPVQPVTGVLGVLGGSKGGNTVSAILDELLLFIRALNGEKTTQKLSNMLSEEKSREVSRILKRLNSILTKIDEGEGTAGALINNKNLYNRVLTLLGRRPYDKYLPSLVEEKSRPPQKK